MLEKPDLALMIAPAGPLRAAINLGNAVLANRDRQTGEPRGISVDLANALAAQLGVGLEMVIVDVARHSVEAVATGAADIGFFAIDPERAGEIAFTPPYVLIEGSYLVRTESHLQANDEVDRDGQVVVVGQGSAYDLHLTRTLKHACIERAASSKVVVDTFLSQDADVAAGVRQQLEADAKRVPGLRLLDGRFMVIEQALAVHRNRGPEAHAYLTRYIDDMNASVFVADALRRHGIEGAAAAPPRQR